MAPSPRACVYNGYLLSCSQRARRVRPPQCSYSTDASRLAAPLLMPAVVRDPNALHRLSGQMHQIDVHVVAGTPDLGVAPRGDAAIEPRPDRRTLVVRFLAQALHAVQVGNDLLTFGDLVIVNHAYFLVHRSLLGWSSRWRGTGIGLPASCSAMRRPMNSTRYLPSRRHRRSLGRNSPKSTSNTARLWQSWQWPLSSSGRILATFIRRPP